MRYVSWLNCSGLLSVYLGVKSWAAQVFKAILLAGRPRVPRIHITFAEVRNYFEIGHVPRERFINDRQLAFSGRFTQLVEV